MEGLGQRFFGWLENRIKPVVQDSSRFRGRNYLGFDNGLTFLRLGGRESLMGFRSMKGVEEFVVHPVGAERELAQKIALALRYVRTGKGDEEIKNLFPRNGEKRTWPLHYMQRNKFEEMFGMPIVDFGRLEFFGERYRGIIVRSQVRNSASKDFLDYAFKTIIVPVNRVVESGL